MQAVLPAILPPASPSGSANHPPEQQDSCCRVSPTYEDVTKPVYQKSIGRWQNYAKYLQPAMEKLTPFIKEFGYESP
jgi:hypothetical protein